MRVVKLGSWILAWAFFDAGPGNVLALQGCDGMISVYTSVREERRTSNPARKASYARHQIP